VNRAEKGLEEASQTTTSSPVRAHQRKWRWSLCDVSRARSSPLNFIV